MNLADLGKVVTKYGAPLLGTLLGGAPGAAIGQLIAAEFGGDANDPADLAEKIQKDPQAVVKLKEIQSREKIELQRLLLQSETARLKHETEQTALANKNTQDAREYNVKVGKTFSQILSIVILTGFFLCIYWIAAFPQDQSDHDVLNVLLGVLATSYGSVIKHWLGN